MPDDHVVRVPPSLRGLPFEQLADMIGQLPEPRKTVGAALVEEQKAAMAMSSCSACQRNKAEASLRVFLSGDIVLA